MGCPAGNVAPSGARDGKGGGLRTWGCRPRLSNARPFLGGCYDLHMPSLDEAILRAVESIPGISVLVLFGSRARGDHRPDSDLDVAVLPESRDPKARRHVLSAIAVALADLAPEGRVDVVFLDQADDVLRQRVMEHGRILLNRDPEAWKELRVRTMREYGDREWIRRPYPLQESLRHVDDLLVRLRSFSALSREEFVQNPAVHHLAERYLHLTCEGLLDVAHQMIGSQDHGPVTSGTGAIEALAEEGLIDQGLAERLKRWMGFRNVLVHLYLEIDHGMAYDAIRDDLGDLERFAASMGRLL